MEYYTICTGYPYYSNNNIINCTRLHIHPIASCYRGGIRRRPLLAASVVGLVYILSLVRRFPVNNTATCGRNRGVGVDRIGSGCCKIYEENADSICLYRQYMFVQLYPANRRYIDNDEGRKTLFLWSCCYCCYGSAVIFPIIMYI